MTLDEMKEFIRGKNVILVGNSLDSLELNHGDWIDGHDVVVRFGKGLTDGIIADKIGARTDIWVTGQLRIKTAQFVNKNTKVLFNESLYNPALGRPLIPHLSMYTDQEIDAIARANNVAADKRLSAGAITGHWFVNVCNTWNTLTFKNFDAFQKVIKFRATISNDIPAGDQHTASWHLPILRPEHVDADYQVSDGTHPAHDIAAEIRLYKEFLTDGNVKWHGGDLDAGPSLFQDALCLWTRGRSRID